jgi:3-hydroxy-9,10-secoandrosta-1,3,5(10)-triene-9,17-dione monooxygenase reductase component
MLTQGPAAPYASAQSWERPSVERLRSALGQLPSGVVVVTSTSPCGELAGATVSSFSSLSFAPPLVVFGLAKSSKTLSAILGHGHFAVHLVAEPQRHLAIHFASSGSDKFADLSFRLSPYNVPLLSEFDTLLQCGLERAQPAGDHQLLIGRVLDVSLGTGELAPVAWFKRNFHACERLASR